MKKNLTKLKIKNFDLTDSASKRYFNRFLFTEVAPKYHIATHFLSFGRDKIWKKKMIKKLPKKEKATCLDIACGTGDITFLLAKKYKDLGAKKIKESNFRGALQEFEKYLAYDQNNERIIYLTNVLKRKKEIEDQKIDSLFYQAYPQRHEDH